MRGLKILPLALFCFSSFAEEAPQTAESSDISVTGFYGGADMGVDLLKLKSRNQASIHKNNTKMGVLLDAFVGGNVQVGRFILGVEGILDFRTAKPRTNISNKTYSLKRKYGFGLAPKIGINIYDSLNGYVTFGALTSKYQIRGDGKKSNPTKTSMFLGVGLEQTFGSMFVRGEVNKVFKKTISKIDDVSMSADSYTFKIGGGYRF